MPMATPFVVTGYNGSTFRAGDVLIVTHTGTRPTALTLSIAFGTFSSISATVVSPTQFSIVVPAQSVGNFKLYRWSGDGGATSTTPADGSSISIIA
jgi:hypothetical protein